MEENRTPFGSSKRSESMNILFFLTPKSMCVYLDDNSTLRQALERMEAAGYAACRYSMRRANTAAR